MDLKALKWLLLVLVAIVQVGCATAGDTSDDPPALDPVTSSHDDSHGWGTSVQGGGH